MEYAPQKSEQSGIVELPNPSPGKTARVKRYWESARRISAKLVGVGAASQPWDSNGQTIFVADAHRGDGKRFIVRADQKLTAFVELERAIHDFAVSLIL